MSVEYEREYDVFGIEERVKCEGRAFRAVIAGAVIVGKSSKRVGSCKERIA